MKRLTFSMVITGVLALAAYSLADAHGNFGQRGFGRPEFAQDGAGPGGPGRGRGGRGFGPMFSLRGIELTDDQKAQIKAIHDAEREAMGDRQGPPADAALHRALQGELFADNPDSQKLAALQQQLVQAQSARLARQIAIEQKVAGVLTAEQRAQVRERLTRRAGPQDDRR